MERLLLSDICHSLPSCPLIYPTVLRDAVHLVTGGPCEASSDISSADCTQLPSCPATDPAVPLPATQMTPPAHDPAHR